MESLSLYISPFLFIDAENKIEIDMKDKISILPFISLMKDSPKNPQNADYLNHELYDILSNENYLNSYKNSPFFINSIEQIVKSKLNFDFTISKIMTPLIISDQYKGNKLNLLNAIYRLSNNPSTTEIDNFFNENGLDLINFSLDHLYEINFLENNNKLTKFNFNCIKSNEIKTQIIKLIESRSNIEINQLKKYISKNCLNSPEINYDKIKKKNERSIDDIITIISSFIKSPTNENGESLCFDLFDFFMREKNNAINYFTILFEKANKKNQKMTPKILLGLYGNMYNNNKDYFVESVNRSYIYNPFTCELIKKNVNEFEKPFSENSLLIISKLFGLINGNSINDSKVFTLLKSIATSFPFLFTTNTTQLYELVLSKLEKSEENILSSKDVIICLSFLQSCLYSTEILDDFINWSFEQITSFNNSQITGLIVLINSIFLSSPILKKVFISCVTKFKFIEKIHSLLLKDVTPICQQKNHYNEVIFKLLINFYSKLLKISQWEITEAFELQKVDNPVCCATGFSLTILPNKMDAKNLDYFKILNNNFNPDHQQFSISYSHSIVDIEDDTVSKFVSKINSINQSKHIKMIQYLIHQPFLIQSSLHIESIDPDQYSNISKALKEIDQICKENDDDLNDVKKIYKDLIDENYCKSLIKLIINLKISYTKNNQYCDTINQLLDVFNSYSGSLLFIFECLNEEIIDIVNNRTIIDLKYLLEFVLYYKKSKYFNIVINSTINENLVYLFLME